MEPESLIVIVCGILLALTMLPRSPKRPAEPRDIEFTDGSEAEEVQQRLDLIARH